MASENLNPLDELKTLDQQVEKVTELAGLKPIFFRLDEIAKQHPNDFEVQLVVGDIKQHLVNRGTRIKEMQQTVPEPPPLPASPPKPPVAAAQPPITKPVSAPPVAAPPPVPSAPPAVPNAPKLMSSGQFVNPPAAPPSTKTPPPTSAPPPLPPQVQKAPLSPTAAAMPPTRKVSPPAPPVPPQGPLATTENVQPTILPAATASSLPTLPSAQGPAMRVPPPSPPPPPPPRKPSGAAPNWKRALAVGALAGSIVSIALIAFLVNQARKRNLAKHPVVVTVQVQIATAPSGASVRINGDVQCTSDCVVPLAPGNYQVTAFLDGYEPAASGISVVAGQPNSINLTLDPQAQSMRILSDLDQGKVVVDGQPAADLQEGQFVLDKVAPGAHMVKVTGRNSDASFAFDVEAGKPPAILGPVAARNLIAVLVSSFGSQGRVVTNSGPLKLVMNGQPEGDVGPAGLDLKNFQPGVDELLVGDGKDQRNMKESFGPAPMLTVFLKSDVNIGTLIVSAGEDDARVFLNEKEYRLRTKRGEVRIPAIGKVTVRVAKDGFQNEPVQTAEVKKGAELRLEFKLKALPQVSTLQLRGATPNAEVSIDQKRVGTVGPDGNFVFSPVAPGDHTVELKRDQFTPKRFQRLFQNGRTVEVTGVEVVLAAIVNPNAVVKLVHTPAEVAITYRRNEETQTRELRGNQIELPPGTYVFTGTAPGYTERSVRFTVGNGETRTVDITLARIPQVAVQVKIAGITDFEDPAAWKQEGDLWVHKGAGFIPFKPRANGLFTFTVTLVHGGSLFRGGRIRWALQFADAKNYDLFELDKKNFWGKVVAKGKTLERARTQHNLDKEKSYTIQLEVTPEHVVHKIRTGTDWLMLDTWAEAGRDFTDGKFGFLIQGNDEIGVSDFKFEPK